MGLLDRWRPSAVPADVGPGFWVTEATAMQRAIGTAMTGAERRRAHVTARLQLSSGAEGVVVVVWRNVNVGFVPPERAAALLDQLGAAGRAPLMTEGCVVERDGLLRIWAGSDAPVGSPSADELAPPPPLLFGILARRGPVEQKPTTTARRWVLTVGADSWEVRDGADLDVGLLRRRIAEAEPGTTLHVRVWDEAVTIHPQTRVTLTDPGTGAVEVLHPR